MRILILFLLLYVSVIVNAQVISNQTYTTTTTLSGCNVTLENVAVENGSKLTVNSKEEVTISGTFNLNGSGSVLEIQTTALMPPILDPTNAVSSLTCNSAISGGNVACDGGATVTERGICWSTSQNPTVANSKVTSGSGTGSFTATLSPVWAGVMYYVRSYATNSAGTGYGEQVSYQGAITFPVVDATTNASNITYNSATSGGNITSDGCGALSGAGICWATTQNPTTSNSTASVYPGTGTFSANLTGLSASTMYYVRSYATNTAGTTYGPQMSFTTSAPVPPSLVPTPIESGPTCSSAISGGNVFLDGGATVTERGVCWGTSLNPTIANSKVSGGSGTGPFTVTISPVWAGVTYYVRSYATNSAGTGYTGNITYLRPILAPTLDATTNASNITYNSATSGGNITSDGCGTLSAAGICWATTQNPTTSNSTASAYPGTGTFSANLTGLSASTMYYVRSYATNTAGTTYGPQMSFTTSAPVPPSLVPTPIESGPTCSSATSGGNVFLDGGATVTERGVCWGTSLNPTTANSKVSSGSGTGPFTVTISPVLAGTTYYVRSYATNSAGTAYTGNGTYLRPILAPTLDATTNASNITYNSATSGGNVTSDGCGSLSARGICWATTQNPTTSNSTASVYPGTGTFSANLTGLSASTTYYVRSYATNTAGTTYGSQMSFTTSAPVVPTLAATSTVSGLTCTSASSGGNVTSDGGATVTSRGICWGTSPNPTTANSKVTSGSGTGSFTATLTSVWAGTTYYVRSYATNSAGTGYGAQVSYLRPITVPVLAATTSASNITYNSASSGGNITSDGCGSLSAKGICWATTQNPTTANSKTSEYPGTGVFTSNLTGLSASTTYYVRSYATNAAGTTYGAQTSFTTLASPIIANISSRSVAGGSTYTVVEWKVTLASAAPSAVSIPYSCTNSTNSGQQTGNWPSIAAGGTTATFTVTYNRPTGANYTATCTFRTMPTGYSAGSTASYTILKQ